MRPLPLAAVLCAAMAGTTPAGGPAAARPGPSPSVEPIRVSGLEEIWTAPLPSPPIAVPQIVRFGGVRAVLQRIETGLAAFDPDTGRSLWSRTDLAGEGWEPHPTARLVDGLVAAWAAPAGEASGRFVLVDLADGATRAEGTSGCRPIGPPLARPAGGPRAPAWYVPCRGGDIAVFDREAHQVGTVVLRREIDPPLVLVLGRVAAVTGPRSELVDVDRPRPRRSLAGVAAGAIALGGEHLAWSNGNLLALARCTIDRRGALRCRRSWRQHLAARAGLPLWAGTGERIFAPSWDTHLYAFDARSGERVWKASAGRRLAERAAFWRGLIAVAERVDPALAFFDARDGRRAGRVGLLSASGARERIAGGVAGDAGMLFFAVVRSPGPAASLRAVRPRAGAEPLPGTPGPARDQPVRTGSPRSAARKRSSRSR